MKRRFVELHARSVFSFLRGASSPEALVQQARHLSMSHLAITDRDGVYGSARAHHEAGELGAIQSIVGAELTMEDLTVLPVLVRTRTGYQNLCRLITRAKLRTQKKNQSRIHWDELEEFAEGLIALTGDEEGPLNRLLSQTDINVLAVNRRIEHLIHVFGRENTLIELQRHRVRGETHHIRHLTELAERHKLTLIASNGASYVSPAGRLLLDAFTCLRHHTTLDEAGLLLAPNSQRYLKSDTEMRRLFPDFIHAVENTEDVAARIEFTLEDLGYQFPELPVPLGHNQDSYLREKVYEGALERYPSISSELRQLLEKELSIIQKLGFSGYFLIVWDIVRFAKGHGILIQGRGSAANSAVCFCLDITKADPIKYKLLFERFLSEGQRKAWPDIDLDLPSGDQRERVIQEMYRRFQPYGAAMTANVITYRGRSAMREMAKVLDLPPDIISRFSALYANGDFPHTLELQQQLKSAGMHHHHPRLPALVKLNHLVKGLPRHLGQHSGGMVLCTKGLDSIVPLEPASMPGRVVVQWDKDDCEDRGIIKVDLLGLGMMAVLEDTINICTHRGRPVDIANLPEDPKVYERMQAADTIGVFQIESRAQMATLPRLKPREFYDVVIEVAIIRPGPIVGNLVHPYLRRRNGQEQIDYIHPLFKDTLERTKGVPLFQEQILKMAMDIAGFTGGEAEELRRAMSFHRSEDRMNKILTKLSAAMDLRQVDATVQQRVVSSIRSFALYGFPESHAISFALLAYASSYLKVHRTAEFTASLLNNQPMGFYSSATLVRDARQHGLRIMPVCVVLSGLCCHVEDDSTIRLGLNQLSGLSRSSAERIVTQRDLIPWQGLNDLLKRCKLSKDERRLLAKSGALNALGYHRRSALWVVEEELQDDLFSRIQTVSTPPPHSPLTPMLPLERLEADYEAQSLTVGRHPMSFVRASLLNVHRACDLARTPHGQHIRIAGLVICRQRPGTAKGHVFVSLEDETGISNAFVPSSTFEAHRLTITQEPFLIIHGRLQNQEGVISIYALEIEPLPFHYELGAKSHDFH